MCKLCGLFNKTIKENTLLKNETESQQSITTDGYTNSYAIYTKSGRFGLKFINDSEFRVYIKHCPLCGKKLSELLEEV